MWEPLNVTDLTATRAKCKGDAYMRVRYFPTAVEKTRAKLRALEQEARDMKANDLLRQLSAVNQAWEREVEIARLDQILRRGDDK